MQINIFMLQGKNIEVIIENSAIIKLVWKGLLQFKHCSRFLRDTQTI